MTKMVSCLLHANVITSIASLIKFTKSVATAVSSEVRKLSPRSSSSVNPVSGPAGLSWGAVHTERIQPEVAVSLVRIFFSYSIRVKLINVLLPLAPLGRKDSDIDDREFFKPRVNGDFAPLHYYPQHGAAPAPPPWQAIPKPSCFGTPQVLQVGAPGSSLFGKCIRISSLDAC